MSETYNKEISRPPPAIYYIKIEFIVYTGT